MIHDGRSHWSEERRLAKSLAMRGNANRRGKKGISQEGREALRASLLGAARHTQAHSSATKALLAEKSRGNTNRRGQKQSSETIEVLRQKQLAHIRNSVDCLCASCSSLHDTAIERTLVNVLLADFPEVRREVKFGYYRVDAYLPPPYHLAFEADGEFWHRNSAKRDAARDAWLLKHYGLPVVRLAECELGGMKR